MVILSPSSWRGKKKKMSYSRKKLLAKFSKFNTFLQNCTLEVMVMYLVKFGLNIEKINISILPIWVPYKPVYFITIFGW